MTARPHISTGHGRGGRHPGDLDPPGPLFGLRQILQICGSVLSAKKEKRFRSNRRQDVADAVGLPQRDVLITKLSVVSMTVRAAPRVCAQRDGSLWRSGGRGEGAA